MYFLERASNLPLACPIADCPNSGVVKLKGHSQDCERLSTLREPSACAKLSELLSSFAFDLISAWMASSRSLLSICARTHVHHCASATTVPQYRLVIYVPSQQEESSTQLLPSPLRRAHDSPLAYHTQSATAMRSPLRSSPSPPPPREPLALRRIWGY